MRRTIGFFVLAVLVFATRAESGPVPGLDLTGTWTGKGKCSGLFEGEKFSFPSAVTVEVSPSGNDFSAAFGFVGTSSPLSFTFSGCGYAVAETAKPDRGRVAVHGFEETAPNTQFGTADISKVSVFAPDKKGRTGKMKGTVFIGIHDLEDLIMSCKLNAERTSQVDPGGPPCTPP